MSAVPDSRGPALRCRTGTVAFALAIRDNLARKMATHVLHVTDPSDIAATARQGAEALQAGKLVGFATETVYGLGALASHAEAMRRLREVKSRPDGPFSVVVSSAQEVARYVQAVPSAARRLMAKGWPGPVTLLLATGGRLPDARLQAAELHDSLSHDGVIGLRCPDEPTALALLAACDGPVVAPSANPAGQPSPRTAGEVLDMLDGQLDLLIDSGPTTLGQDSTIVRFDDDEWKVLRPGPCDLETLRRMMGYRLLFVCTGNTCRSPMAAGLARRMLAEREGCRPSALRERGLEIASAGVLAVDGARATPEAVRAARKLGADISGHRSTKLTPELLNAYDVVFCMTEVHAGMVRRIVPSAAGKLRMLLAEGDVSDPMGGGQDVYDDTARRMEEALTSRLNEEAP